MAGSLRAGAASPARDPRQARRGSVTYGRRPDHNPIILIDLLGYSGVIELRRGLQSSPGSRALHRRTPAGWLALAVTFAVSAVAPGMPVSEATVLAWLTAARSRLRPAAPSPQAQEPRCRD